MPPVMLNVVGHTRLQWVDAAKGLGIVLVVYGHVVRGLVASSGLGDQAALSTVDYVIYTFHMPLFFFLAGLFARPSYKKGMEAFWIGKLHTIAYPYFLWSLIQGSLLILFSRFTNSHSSIDRIINILWAPIAPFWFLYALFFCHVFFILLRTLHSGALLLSALGLFLVGELYRFEIHDMSVFSNLDRHEMLTASHSIHDISVVSDIGRGFLYYTIGVLASQRLGKTVGLAPPWIIPAILAFAIAATAGLWFKIPYETNIPAALLGIATIVIICRTCSDHFSAMEYLGTRSMAIFVMHIAVAAGVRIILMKFLHVSGFLPNLISGVFFGLLIPCLVYNLADRLGFVGWLGFTSLRPRRVLTAAPKAHLAKIAESNEIVRDLK